MLALIMAGGEGTRLNLGEKPLAMVHGTPMLASVVEAFEEAECEVVVVLTPYTPYTQNWCRARGITMVTTAGNGYIEDLVEAVIELEETDPLFTSISDLPFLRSSTIRCIGSAFQQAGKPACATWIPLRTVTERGISYNYCEDIEGIPSVPAGINILRGSMIGEPQEEARFLVDAPDLAFHINTRSDLEIARNFPREILAHLPSRIISLYPPLNANQKY
ncbi:MAG: NTP transferase domain-containing protein [Methanomicrobiales archaeon]|nr:NTP transferase domain-containing protein [Methanomicrobiales archaeon]